MRKVSLISCIVLCVSLFSGTSFAAYLVDGPGTVKTTNILDGAVTTSKLASSAVTTAKLADGAVTTTKILDSAVTSTKIANGAVTDAKISGLISASKISSVGLNADTVDGQHASAFALASHTQAMSTVSGLDAALAGKSDVTHNHDGAYQKKYSKVIVVATDGNGDFTDPKAAMASISDASAANTYLIKIMPGDYSIMGYLLMKSYVDIEGSGKNVTKIQGWSSFVGNTTAFLASEVNFAEVRDITVEMIGPSVPNSGIDTVAVSANLASVSFTNVNINAYVYPDGVWALGILATNSNLRLTNVKIHAERSGPTPGSLTAGILFSGNNSGPMILNGVTIETIGNGSNVGIMGQGNTLMTIRNSDISGDYALDIGTDINNNIKVYNSSIRGGSVSINVGAENTLMMAGSELAGAVQGTGTVKITNCFDGSFNPIANQ